MIKTPVIVHSLDQGRIEGSVGCPLEKVTLDGLEKFTYVSYLLSNEEREQLQLVLLNNIDVFA